MQYTKKNKRALSGAVVALILVIAAVIIALVVVGFAFGLFSSLTGSGGTVTQVGTGTISSANGQITITLKNTGSAVTISSITIQGTNYPVTTATANAPVTVSPGTSTYTIAIPNTAPNYNSLTSYLQAIKGSTITVTINLSNGQGVSAALLVT